MRVVKSKSTHSPRTTKKRSLAINNQLRLKAIVKLLRAGWRHPENSCLRDSTYCTSIIDRLLRSDSREMFTQPFGSIVGEELFQQFTELKASYNQVVDRPLERKPRSDTDVPNDSQNPVVRQSVAMALGKRKEPWLLWKFILCLLEMPGMSDYIFWVDKSAGTFKFTKKLGSTKVAKLWGFAKQNSKMNYDFMARSFRDYYGGIFHHLHQRLVYSFNWNDREVLEFAQALANPSKVEYFLHVENLVRDYNVQECKLEETL